MKRPWARAPPDLAILGSLLLGLLLEFDYGSALAVERRLNAAGDLIGGCLPRILRNVSVSVRRSSLRVSEDGSEYRKSESGSSAGCSEGVAQIMEPHLLDPRPSSNPAPRVL